MPLSQMLAGDRFLQGYDSAKQRGMGEMQQALTLSGLIEQQRMRQMQAQEAQRKVQRDAEYRARVVAAGGDPEKLRSVAIEFSDPKDLLQDEQKRNKDKATQMMGLARLTQAKAISDRNFDVALRNATSREEANRISALKANSDQMFAQQKHYWETGALIDLPEIPVPSVTPAGTPAPQSPAPQQATPAAPSAGPIAAEAPTEEAATAMARSLMGRGQPLAVGVGHFPSGYAAAQTPSASVAAPVAPAVQPRVPTATPSPVLPGLAPKASQAIIADREKSYPEATQGAKIALENLKALEKQLSDLKMHPGLPGITGAVYGRTPSVTPNSMAAQQIYENVVNNIFINALQAMRSASKTGGALGQVTEKEGERLEKSLAALGRAQGTKDFQNQVQIALGRLAEAKKNIVQAYDETYSYKGAKLSSVEWEVVK